MSFSIINTHLLIILLIKDISLIGKSSLFEAICNAIKPISSSGNVTSNFSFNRV